ASATPAETDVVQGKALAGLSTPPITSAAVAAGAPLKIIGAAWQKNPYCIVYLRSKPIPNPKAMIGKRIGVQAANTSAWHAFLTANSISPSQLTTVPVQSDPTELTSGTVDGWYGFITAGPPRRPRRRMAGLHHGRADRARAEGVQGRRVPAGRLPLPAGRADHPDAHRHDPEEPWCSQGPAAGRDPGLE